MLVNVFKVEIKTLKHKKFSTAFVFMLQEMNNVAESNGGLVYTYYTTICEMKTKS